MKKANAIAADEEKSSRILIISPNWIGDAIMAQPLLKLLKLQNPMKPIDVLAPSWVAPVWKAMCEVDAVYETLFKHGVLQFKERWKWAQFLRPLKYDEAYVLPNTLKFALIPWLAKIPHRKGYLGEMRYGLLNEIHQIEKRQKKPMVSFYAALANPPAMPFPDSKDLPLPNLSVSEKEVELVKIKMGVNANRLIIGFAPGAEFGSAKRWPISHFVLLAKMIIAEYPEAQILLLGSYNDKNICDEIKQKEPSVLNFAGKTSLKEAIALISGLDMLVTNDSGLMHVASAFNLPVIAIYGSTDYQHTPPLSIKSEIISLDLKCAPCQKKECPLGHHNCMKQLLPETVYLSINKYLTLIKDSGKN